MNTKTINISGNAVTISAPYVVGQTINAAEARALNQTRAENIGNNFRKAIKEAADEAALSKVLAELAEYDTKYNFSMTIARAPADPIEAEAERIAKEYVLAKIQTEKGFKSLKAYFAADPENEAKYDAAVEAVSLVEDTLKLAKQRVANKAKTAGIQSSLNL